MIITIRTTDSHGKEKTFTFTANQQNFEEQADTHYQRLCYEDSYIADLMTEHCMPLWDKQSEYATVVIQYNDGTTRNTFLDDGLSLDGRIKAEDMGWGW